MKTSITAVLVDDERDSLSAIQQKIKLYCPNVSIQGTFTDSRKALLAIQQMVPDVVFLDIQMPGMTGLELALALSSNKISIVFVTAFNQYAIDAIKLSALDYLLKPVDPDELRIAVDKVFARLSEKGEEDANRFPILGNLIKNNQTQSYSQETIIGLPDEKGIIYVKIREIIRVEADRNYCNFHLLDGTKVLVSKNIGTYIDGLKQYNLVQVHRSHVVNLQYVKRLVKISGPYLVMCDNSNVPVTANFKGNL
jgi:two-component system, LytTR family, response regulator